MFLISFTCNIYFCHPGFQLTIDRLKNKYSTQLNQDNSENFKDITKSEDFNSETEIKIQLKGIVKKDDIVEPKKDVEKYINKVGKAVMPISKPEETKEEISVKKTPPNDNG